VKIALVILRADIARGGAERYTLDLAAGLQNRGHAVSILAASFGDFPGSASRVVLPAGGWTRTGRYLKFLDSLDRAVDVGGYDIVHAMLPVRRCDVYHPHAGIAAEAVSEGHLVKSGRLAQWLAKLGNRFNPRRQKFAEVERRLLTSADPPLVLCLSGLIQQVVRRNYPSLPSGRLRSLFNGIDLGKFDPALYPAARAEIRQRLGIAESAILGLILAQDFERKGVRQAIEALAQAADDRLCLLIGGKPDATKYRRLAERLGLGGRVIFTGAVDRPAEYYRAVDFFLLPTRFDPCSLVVLESLAMGLPVISTIKNGACEIMQDNVHGRVLTDPDDIPTLADALRQMLEPSTRASMASACLSLRPQLSQAHHLENLTRNYTDV
jgi:UDP-glucose:(heptosyl)LPS alpha-1,3-glucosyltransferase